MKQGGESRIRGEKKKISLKGKKKHKKKKKKKKGKEAKGGRKKRRDGRKKRENGRPKATCFKSAAKGKKRRETTLFLGGLGKRKKRPRTRKKTRPRRGGGKRVGPLYAWGTEDQSKSVLFAPHGGEGSVIEREGKGGQGSCAKGEKKLNSEMRRRGKGYKENKIGNAPPAFNFRGNL